MFGRLLITLLKCIVGQRILPRGCHLAMSLVDLIGQRFLLRGRQTSLVGLVGQRFLPCSRLVATLLVKSDGIEFGHLFGGERRGKMSRLMILA